MCWTKLALQAMRSASHCSPQLGKCVDTWKTKIRGSHPLHRSPKSIGICPPEPHEAWKEFWGWEETVTDCLSHLWICNLVTLGMVVGFAGDFRFSIPSEQPSPYDWFMRILIMAYCNSYTHTIHGTCIFTYIWLFLMVKYGKCRVNMPYMEHMGYIIG